MESTEAFLNVVVFKTRKDILIESMKSADQARQKGLKESLKEIQSLGHDNFWDGPAGEWMPEQSHIQAVCGYAANFYDGPRLQDFSLGDLLDTIISLEYAGTPDFCLTHLNDAQLGELIAYGEKEEWSGLSIAGFKAWRAWSAAPVCVR